MSYRNSQLQKDAIKTHHSNLRSPIPEPGSSARLSLIKSHMLLEAQLVAKTNWAEGNYFKSLMCGFLLATRKRKPAIRRLWLLQTHT
ncbi:hypothetical protein [Vandammella animalimorsus]|nr:hypothetical protein [Vandammella animalimorsus]